MLSACNAVGEVSGATDQKLNILMVSDFLFGHMAKALPLGEELIHRGHNVTLLVIVYEDEQVKYKNHVEKYGVHLWNVSSENLPKILNEKLTQKLTKAF